MSIYSTKTMLKAVNTAMPVHTFLMDTFFPNFDTSVTEKVEFDVKKGKRKMAPFVAPRIGGKVIAREGFDTKELKPAKIAPVRILTQDDISRRGIGENTYSQRTAEDREKELLAEDLIELEDTIVRREEWMCRETLINGKIVMSGEGFDQEVDYKFTNKTALSGIALWTAIESDPIAQLAVERRSIIKKTGKAPNIVVMASDAADAFLDNAKVKEYFDKLNINMGTIEPSIKDDSVTFIARIPVLNMELYSYDEWFLDDDDVEQPMIPSGHVIVGRKAAHKRLYGAFTQAEKGEFVTFEGRRVPKVWMDEENEIKKVRLVSRPIPVPDDVEGWAVRVVI